MIPEPMTSFIAAPLNDRVTLFFLELMLMTEGDAFKIASKYASSLDIFVKRYVRIPIKIKKFILESLLSKSLIRPLNQ
jgi:hypothetical protein